MNGDASHHIAVPFGETRSRNRSSLISARSAAGPVSSRVTCSSMPRLVGHRPTADLHSLTGHSQGRTYGTRTRCGRPDEECSANPEGTAPCKPRYIPSQPTDETSSCYGLDKE